MGMKKNISVELGRRDFLALTGLSAAALISGCLHAETGERKPNIVVIFADDLGYADLGIQGCKDIPTPNLDAFARAGVRCTNGYVSCPVCSPTRAGLMTGRYQQRFGHWYNPGSATEAAVNFGLPLTEITIADILKQAGYTTGLVGKWHLGYQPEFHPQKRGFDEFFGFLGGAHSYIDAKAEPKNPIMRGTDVVDEPEYLTHAFTREAVSFIDRNKEKPFFLYLSYNAVHGPLQAPPEYVDRFKDIADNKRRIHAAQVSAMDDGVGKVLDKLKDAGLEKDTMVFFLSDNGGPTQGTGADNTPLRGVKGNVWEGGIRVPFFIRYPRRIPAGMVYHKPVISLDIIATCAAAAQAALPSDRVMDGVDLISYLTGPKKDNPHDTLFWAFVSGRAVRQGPWKLVIEKDASPVLFNLDEDIKEANNVAANNGPIVESLQQALKNWEKDLKPPLWEPGGKKTGQKKPGEGRKRRKKPAA